MEYLKPLLSRQLTNKWIDRAAYPDDNQFIRAYDSMHQRALAYQDIINLVDGASKRIADIEARVSQIEKVKGV